ncbi:protein WHAT'S THIS FACTOR 9, mitochondrial [Coffea arabica]|uniref:Protein WHAT'S THIS FACTOR 9, mitochondrial n=1 Tax=Coffea arabica TaxID=13443 RepID=A0A6P6WCR5_COFAR|nr:protein WHAT'S THIS FACTOR 9, mitochondrial [Coffea arabica]XP_027113223.1 protein WHAT'S THIS FACTOR 9, mitochondrial [Coffea arabica]XP_027113224.1 protein WHAT'S THIS FACTOR 9, mitochondrial [Coffea arabica]
MAVLPLLLRIRRRHQCLHHQIRTFINAKVKWVRDPYLDKAVENEKNLKPLLSLKNLIMSQPSETLPLSSISPLKTHLNLPTTASKFAENYPLIFKIFNPPTKRPMIASHPHVKLTSKAISLHNDETLILNLSHYKKDVAERLAKLLMLTRAKRLPFYVIDKFQFDLGLPHDYKLSFLPDFPDYFSICEMGFKDFNGYEAFGLELVRWREDLAASLVEKLARNEGIMGSKLQFSMNFPRGFDLEKRVKDWVEEWQNLPYISPYEDAFHLAPNSDQAEKWAVGVIHELLSLMVSKKMERDNVYLLGDYLVFGLRFKMALVRYPGIFYVSNKISTQTVVLREAYRKNFLIEKHPLMKMRYKYIKLMNTVMRRGRPMPDSVMQRRKRSANAAKGGKRKEKGDEWTEQMSKIA